jgi:hypothetical protein
VLSVLYDVLSVLYDVLSVWDGKSFLPAVYGMFLLLLPLVHALFRDKVNNNPDLNKLFNQMIKFYVIQALAGC